MPLPPVPPLAVCDRLSKPVVEPLTQLIKLMSAPRPAWPAVLAPPPVPPVAVTETLTFDPPMDSPDAATIADPPFPAIAFAADTAPPLPPVPLAVTDNVRVDDSVNPEAVAR